ncbi:lysosomal aspartic protease-like [Camponotus floridanus]|uniref:lysosomal aspartic protease-like n=1 Tax=Camponotus floridanus TaxID=104421 RepID=UPI000DC68638|nr:lysosomal aspartic protease-like [Camponotus floridanus]
MFCLLVGVTVLYMTIDAQIQNILFPNFWPEMDLPSNLHEGADRKLQKVRSIRPLPSVRLTNIDNVTYYGTIKIGNPPKEVKVIFDTTSQYLRIFPKNFSTNPVPLARSRSSSFNPYIVDNRIFHVPYHDYNVTGFLSMGTVKIADINVERQVILEVVNISGMPNKHIFKSYSNISDQKYDGILGLSYQQTFEPLSVFQNMIDQWLVAPRAFSIYLNRSSSADLGGKLIFGGFDSAYYKQILAYVPVTRRGYWQFTIDRIEMNQVRGNTYEWCRGGCQAIIDTSTWKIMGPEEDVSAINRLFLSNIYKTCRGIEYLPFVTFKIRGKEFDLNGEEYMIRNPDNKSTCITVFWKLETTYKYNVKWVLGMPFIRRFYTEFDMEGHQLGFALVKNAIVHLENDYS